MRERTDAGRGRTAAFILLFLVLGALLGAGSKFLDTQAVNDLPQLFQTLDVTNFLGRSAVWITLAVFIACLSGSPFRAAWYVFAFFLGMVGAYYLYSRFGAGFFPRSYAMVWFGLTLASPFLALLCWYAKGEGILGIVLSACILAVLIDLTFSYGAFYVDPVSPLELVFLAATLLLLRRKQMVSMVVLAVALAIAIHGVPFPWTGLS